MKPTKLILCGWGPYSQKQEIDFSRLDERGLFLITGATGAGKTTIFDAITYALYGTMSGTVREKNSVRSDFAKEDMPTYVELFMTHGSSAYHIYRNPEYLRPKKRKTGGQDMTKEKERAYLTLPSGEKIEGSSEVTGKIKELLRLDYRQFKQLSLIAQGEFTKLLTANSGEKSRIFREIFDTEMYDRMAGELRSRSSALYKHVMEFRHRMEEDITFFQPTDEHKRKWEELTGDGHYYYDGILQFLSEANEELEVQYAGLVRQNAEAEMQVEELTAKVSREEQIRTLYQKRQEQLLLKEQLKQQAKRIAEKEERLHLAQQALEVQAYEQANAHAKTDADEAEQKVLSLQNELIQLRKRQEKEQEFGKKTKQLEQAYESELLWKKLEEQKEELAGQFTACERELRELQKEYLQAEEKEELAKAAYELADKQYRHAMAGLLAQELAENIPCPVCGSLKHPAKAKLPKEVATKQEVEQKKQIFEVLRKEGMSLHGKTSACNERKSLIYGRLVEAEKEAEVLRQKRENRDSFEQEYLKKYTKEQFLDRKKEYEECEVRIREKEKLLQELQKEHGQKLLLKEQAQAEFDRQCILKGFASTEAYKEAFLPERGRKDVAAEISVYREACHANEQMCIHLEQELQGKQPGDIEKLKEQLEDARSIRNTFREELEKKKYYGQEINRLTVSLQEKQKQMQKLEQQYAVVKRLDDTASGNNRLRLVFEQYVLAAYFEEILRAANIRLKVMSSGRYELRRAETVADGRSKDNLEMEVLDYYTGKYRSVKTLSGGESFKTSLALALGMSDVVQALSGGVRVETLFIDEGFGSLDSESLEQACITLQSLVERDRLIGIISHVPELSEKISDQIKIHKTNVGSRIEVMVS